MAQALAEREKVGRVTRRRPLESLFGDVWEEMERLWNVVPFAGPRMFFPTVARPTRWSPRVDFFEDNDKLVVQVELPGLKKEDVEITLGEGNLIISGERKEERKIEEENYYRAERAVGRFYRCLRMPAEVKAEDIQAQFQDGILEIRIPKPAAAEAKSQKISIK